MEDLTTETDVSRDTMTRNVLIGCRRKITQAKTRGTVSRTDGHCSEENKQFLLHQ